MLKSILIAEDRNSSNFIKQAPIDIENSYIGKDIKDLKDTMIGSPTIQPYCDVGLRVIIRIADILQQAQ